MSKRVVTLGKWEDKPIEWIVLKEEGILTLIISKYVLYSQYFSNNSSKWEESDIRTYLNGEFFETAFTEIEKKKIINFKLNDVGNVKDNVSILSKEEAETLLTSDERKFGNGKCNVSCYWENCSTCYRGNNDGYSTCWTLRTVCDNSNIYRCCTGGGIYPLPINNSHGIRPAMWIKE